MSQTFGKRVFIFFGLGLILEIHFAHLQHYFFLTDDAFISFRYLQNWIEGQGLVFNPGERVEGYTNFLWIVLLAPFAILHLAPEKVAPILSALASFIVLILVFCFPRLARLEKDPQPGWLLAPLFLALHRSFAVWATSGLETRCFTLLIFLGAIFAWRACQNLDRRDPLWAGVFFALAELCRPEASLFFLVAGGLVFGLRRLQRQPLFASRDLAGLALFALVFLAHYLGRRWYYGLWFPNTYYAKIGRPWWSMGLYYLGMFTLEYSYWIWLPLLAAFAVQCIRRRNLLAGFLVCFPLPYLIYLVYLGGDHFEYRFLDPGLPFLALLLQECLRSLARADRSRLRQLGLAGFTLVFLAYSTALPWASGLGFGTQYIQVEGPLPDLSQAPWLKALPGLDLLARRLVQGYGTMTHSMVGVRAENHRLFGLLQTAQGHLFQDFIRRGYLTSSETIGLGPIGAVSYYSRLFIVDLNGLTDPVIARIPSRRPVRSMFHDRGPTPAYLQQRNLDYILEGSYLLRAQPGEPPPIFPAVRRFDLKFWTDRTYLLSLDSFFLLFGTPQAPAAVLARFQQRSLPVWLYLNEGDQVVPVPLEQALRRFPELARSP